MYRGTGADLVSADQVLISDSPKPRTTYACPNKSGMCITKASESQVREYARKKCGTMTVVRGYDTGLGAVSCGLSQIGVANYTMYDPCWLKTLPTCGDYSVPEPDRPVIIPQGGPGTPSDEDDESSYVVGGLLALLIAGGVAYAVFKRKKKGKR